MLSANELHSQHTDEDEDEDPIPPGMRLAICLYRLGRGDYYFTTAELSGVDVSTVAGITDDVCDAVMPL